MLFFLNKLSIDNKSMSASRFSMSPVATWRTSRKLTVREQKLTWWLCVNLIFLPVSMSHPWPKSSLTGNRTALSHDPSWSHILEYIYIYIYKLHVLINKPAGVFYQVWRQEAVAECFIPRAINPVSFHNFRWKGFLQRQESLFSKFTWVGSWWEALAGNIGVIPSTISTV